MKNISPEKLVPLDLFESDYPITIALDYARPDNQLFRESIYSKTARLWLYEDLARIVLLAAQICRENHDLSFILHDGLRTTEAQTRMLETDRVKNNPQWLEEPRLLSPPGAGGHPRGMAVDISLADMHGAFIDMGTPFDFLAENPSAEQNPAHRQYKALSQEARTNRDKLNSAMAQAARTLGIALLPLPQEWWDFRLPGDMYDEYAPLSDSSLPPQMQMTDGVKTDLPDFPDDHFKKLKQSLAQQIQETRYR